MSTLFQVTLRFPRMNLNFDMPVEVEIGISFGSMKEYVPP